MRNISKKAELESGLKKIRDIIVRHRNIFFFLLLLVTYYFLGYFQILFLRPQGIHFIRQTDSLSFVLNYYKNGMHFFEPQVFNLYSENGKAACEFPVLYYITALLYKVLGEREFILRFITVTIVSFGVFSLFKLLSRLLNDIAYALTITFLFLSSTVLLYYTNNFLPDASALGFTLIGWYFFYRYYLEKSKKKFILLSFLFFTLSSLLKVTHFLYPVAAILTLFILDFVDKTDIKQTFRRNSLPLTLFTISLFIVVSWNIYAIHYNKVNNDIYFLVSSRPLWSIDKTHISETWKFVTHSWYSSYYSVDVFHFLYAVIIAGLFFMKKSNKFILIVTFFTTAGAIIYFVLFFVQFKDHDYYFITIIPALIFLFTNSFIALKARFTKMFNSVIMKLIFVIIAVVGMSYAGQKLKERYKNKDDKFAAIGVVLSDAKKQIDSLNIPKSSKFIIYTDKTKNGGLYFIEHKGWNIPDTSAKSVKKLNIYISNGADYLLCTGNNKPPIENNFKIIFKSGKFSIYKIK